MLFATPLACPFSGALGSHPAHHVIQKAVEFAHAVVFLGRQVVVDRHTVVLGLPCPTYLVKLIVRADVGDALIVLGSTPSTRLPCRPLICGAYKGCRKDVLANSTIPTTIV